MPKIKITNPRNVIEAPIKKNYFKIRATSGPKGDKGDTGATGPQGPQGPQGNAATIYVGSTTTLPVGQDATVENVGSQYAAVLNFGIPQGPQGPQGAKGDKGDKGDKGEQGNTGNTGPAGQNATVYIGTTTTGAPGSQASVYNSGTENNAVLNFTIPQGAKGDTGATGATGPQGPAGQDGKDFAPSVVDSLPAVGEESKLYLTPKAHTTQTATGNPITATITDGAGQIEDFQLDGDTYQQSYSGKNLFQIPDSTTIGGVTLTKNLDGSFGLSGTATTDIEFSRVVSLADSGIVGSQSYTISSDAPIETYGISYYVHSVNSIGQWNKTLLGFRSEGTQTAAAPSTDYIKFVVRVANGMAVNYPNIKTMLEAGSTASDYEPFVGGIASPNPSYPQPIQVVTGEQTVSKVGKNLFNKDNYQDIRAFIQSDGIIKLNDANRAVYIPCEPNTTYTVSHVALPAGSNKKFGVAYSYVEPQGGTQTYGFIRQDSATSITITTDADARYLIAWLWVNDYPITYLDYLATVQIEKGSTATSYAPYHKQTLPISLGSIELCKLGSYQDYIYKDGDTWKVHKATGYFDFSGQTSANGVNKQSSTGLGGFVFGAFANPIPNYANPLIAYSNYFRVENTNSTWTEYGKMGVGSSGALWFKTIDNTHTDDRTVSQFVAWLRGTPVNLYYALATATDTEITDATLISQLNAIASASLETGTNTLTNSATGSNLAGDMEVDYFGYDPTNRYDKWLWLDINNAYEKLGS